MGVKPTDAELSAILSEIDLTYHGQLEIQDYLQVVVTYMKGEHHVCVVITGTGFTRDVS